MSWNYELFNCLRYEYPNEPPGPEHPSLPPTPPAGWPLPRVGEVLPVDQNDDRFTPFKARVIGVEWDYETPRVIVQLEVVREQNTDDQNDVIRQAKAEALREAANDIERRINAPDLILLADKYGGFHAGERYRAQREVYLLRERAAKLRGADQ